MQNEQTLLDLGFTKDEWGEYIFKANKVSFMGEVITCNGPVYVQLFKISDKIDSRPLSPFKGRHLRSLIKDCCSNGSVERTIKKYDV